MQYPIGLIHNKGKNQSNYLDMWNKILKSHEPFTKCNMYFVYFKVL